MKTIYRYGQDVASDSLYWFHWADDVCVVRGPIAADTTERTYFTGDSTFPTPRMTVFDVATSGATCPTVSYRMGIDAPAIAPVAVVGGSVGGKSITGITVTAAGSGYTSAAVVSISAPTSPSVANGGTQATATVKLARGSVATLVRGTAGSGYATATVTISAPPTGGTQATGSATVVNGAVTELIIVNAGAGYITAPSVSISAPNPRTAVAGLPVLVSTALAYVSIIDGGAGYTSAPAVTVSSGAGTATATISNGAVVSITVSGGVYTTAPTLAIAAPATTLATGSSTVTEPADRITGFTITDSGAGYVTATVSVTVGAGFTGTVETSDGDAAETRVYVATFVSQYDEESGPSGASNSVEVRYGQHVTLTLPSLPAGSTPTDFQYIRVYRTATGSGATNYLYVGSVPVTATVLVDQVLGSGADSVAVLTSGSTYTVTGGLGEVMAAMDYAPPPDDLTCLTALPSGVLAGLSGSDVCFSEPYRPHAWPVKYRQTLDAKGVGLGVIDTTVVVLTDRTPYLISGSHPETYSMMKSEIHQACVSRRSIANVDGGVVFASPDGLFLVGGGSTRNLTDTLFSRSEWSAMSPSTMSGYVIDNAYIGFYGGTSGFIFDLSTGDFVTLNWYASAGFYDPQRDALFLVTGGRSLVKFNSNTSNMAMIWKSKEFYSARPVSMAVARVEAASYPVTFKLYADGILKLTQTVANSGVFRLPSGFMANSWTFEVSGSNEIYSAGMATALEEIIRA